MRPRDFSGRRKFPGTPTRGFHFGIKATLGVQSIPAPLFTLILVALAFAGARARVPLAVAVALFMFGDWVLVALLPRLGRSFGPPKPQVLALAILRAFPALLPVPVALAAQAAGTLLVIYGFWIEPHRVTLTRERLRHPGLGPGRPLRVVHFGDLHIERVTRRERAVIETVAGLEPDLIVFTGDFLSTSSVGDPVAWEACRWVLSRLRAPLGVMVVAGSPAVDRPDVLERLVDGLPIRWLRDERVTVSSGEQTIEVVGLSCTHKPFVDARTLQNTLGTDREPGRFTLLLYHAPDLAPEAAVAGVSLQLSGHTHGGQVRLPFYGALITSSLYGKRFEVGRHELNGLTLYVTRGLGMEGWGAPRVRFLCPPEVVLWELEGV